MKIKLEARTDEGETIDEKDLDPEELRVMERAIRDLGDTLNDAIENLDEDDIGYDECSRELDIQYHTYDKISALWSSVTDHMEVY